MAAHDKYDRDPEALTWARAKVQAGIDRAEKFVEQATAADKPEAAQKWRYIANLLRNSFIGGEGCVIARFDERLPELRKALDNARPALTDRTEKRDHR